MNTVPKEYSRDKRSPQPKSEVVSRVMSANKAKDTDPELALRKALWAEGKRGYRLHKRVCSTRPDIVYPTKKVAVFVNGCFWHRCPHCKLPLPKNNKEFWKEKFKKNKARDKKKVRILEENGWKVHTIWECEIKKDPENPAHKVQF